MGTITATKIANGYTLALVPGRSCAGCKACIRQHETELLGGRQIEGWYCQTGGFWTRLRASCNLWEAKHAH